MKIKPDLSFWKLWNLSFGFFWRTDCLRPAKCKRLKNIHNDWCRPTRSELFLDSSPSYGSIGATYSGNDERQDME